MISKRLIQTIFNESMKSTVKLKEKIDAGELELDAAMFTLTVHHKLLLEFVTMKGILNETEPIWKQLEDHWQEFRDNKWHGRDE